MWNHFLLCKQKMFGVKTENPWLWCKAYKSRKTLGWWKFWGTLGVSRSLPKKFKRALSKRYWRKTKLNITPSQKSKIRGLDMFIWAKRRPPSSSAEKKHWFCFNNTQEWTKNSEIKNLKRFIRSAGKKVLLFAFKAQNKSLGFLISSYSPFLGVVVNTINAFIQSKHILSS